MGFMGQMDQFAGGGQPQPQQQFEGMRQNYGNVFSQQGAPRQTSSSLPPQAMQYIQQMQQPQQRQQYNPYAAGRPQALAPMGQQQRTGQYSGMASMAQPQGRAGVGAMGNMMSQQYAQRPMGQAQQQSQYGSAGQPPWGALGGLMGARR